MTKQYGTRVDAPIVAGNDDTDDIASAINSQIRGGLKFFATEAQMRDWSAKFKSRVFGSVAFVLKNTADQVPQAFKWNGANEDGSDGSWDSFEFSTLDLPTSGISFVMPDGSTVTGIELLALSGLELTGNEKEGFTLTAKGGGGLTFEERSNYSEYQGINRVLVGPGLELNALKDKQDGPVTGVEFGVKPGLYAYASAPGMLAYLNDPVEVVGKLNSKEVNHRGAIWLDDIVYQDRMYIPSNMADKTIGLQDWTRDDPNVTGGAECFICIIAYAAGVAPEDGVIRVEWVDVTTNEVAKDMNGQPVAVQRHVKQGQEITPSHDPFLIPAIMQVKGINNYKLVVSDSFSSDVVELQDYTNGPTGIVIQFLSKSMKMSGVLASFQADTGFDVRPEVKYMGRYRAGLSYFVKEDAPMVVIPDKTNSKFTDNFTVNAISSLAVAVSDGTMQFRDNGDVCNFYAGYIFNNSETRTLRGREVDVEVALRNKDMAFNVSMYAWTGIPDEYTTIYDGEVNYTPTLNKDWVLVKSRTITEAPLNNIMALTETFIVPLGANNYAIVIAPVNGQSPMTLDLKKFQVDVAEPFYGYTEKLPRLVGLEHLNFLDNVQTFVMNTQGYAGLGYTIPTTEVSMPIGWGYDQATGVWTDPTKLKGSLVLDPTVNVISGSAAKGGEGGIKTLEEGELTLNAKLLLWNDSTEMRTINFYWVKIDVDGVETKVGGDNNFEVNGGTKGAEFIMNPFKTQAVVGDRYCLRAKADGEVVEALRCMNDAKPMVKVTASLEGLVSAGN